MKNKEKVLALYNYISEISKNLKNTKTNINEEKWLEFFRNFPKHKNIAFEYENLDEKYFENEESKLLEIKRPDFTKPLHIDKDLLPWIEGDWGDYRAVIEINEKTFIGDEESGSGEIADITPEIEAELQKELEKREQWVEEQLIIEEVRNFFDTLYIKYLELNKETETLELMIGNGIVRIKERNIYYPILLKKIKIDFNTKDNILILSDPHSNESFSPVLYTNFLNEINDIHLENVFELEKEVKDRNLHPLNRKETADFFKKFIHSLTNRGRFIENGNIEDLKEDRDVLIEDNPLIFVRKKETGIVNAIDNIIDKIEKNGEIPAHLYELVGVMDEGENENVEQKKNFKEEEILFVKDANSEQINIARQIERNNAVVVQGPPGTGKTHTIANLLGHFLAQGKNVLVTSQTKKALRVLKEKIPKSIQGLCISILDDDNSDMRKSVETISEKLGNFTSEKLGKEVEELEKIRMEEYNNLENINNQMCAMRYKESNSINFNGETFSIQEIGEYLRENSEISEKIPGKISELIACPITNEEFNFLSNEYRQLVTENEEKEIVSGLNDIADYLDENEFRELVNNKKLAWEELKKIINEDSFNISDNILYVNGKETIDLKKFKENYNTRDIVSKELIKNIEKWKVDAAVSGGTNSGNKANWKNFMEDIKKAHKYLNNMKPKLFKKKIDISGADPSVAAEMIQELKDAFDNPGFVFGLNIKKIKNKIGKRITLNGEPIKDITECNLLLEYLDLLIREKELKESWKELIENHDGISADSLGESFIDYAFESIKEIEYFFNWNYLEKEKLLKDIEDIGIDKKFIFKETNISIEEIKNILNSGENIEKTMEIGNKALKFLEKEEKHSLYLAKIKNISKKDSELDEKLKNSVKNEDTEEYVEYLKQMEKIQEKQKYYQKRENILEKISKTAPEWHKVLKTGNADKVEDIEEVWKWKQLSQELDKLEKEPYEILEKKAAEKRKNIKKVTLELVEKKSWYHVLCFIEKKENLLVSQALRGWEQTIQKIGKGTGKNAALYRKQAKEKMAVCQKAVPAWIMPINKVIDTLNPAENKFDIIIIDEASQSDISSLVLLYMTKKVIIVGDEKQVSPLDIGINVEKINSLREKYIKGKIINDDLYGLNSSLYSVAATTYQPLMLKEHFRCVPEIIGYSNKNSYDLKIKPLRKSDSSALKPAVIDYKVSGTRDEKRKINMTEAQTVTALLKSCLELEEYAESSFGVISLLGDEQSELIQKMIVEKIELVDIEKHNILCGNPSHFQGDERDVMFLTMVDSNSGRSSLRKMSDGTEAARKKRYNVAASRAKNQMWVINSLDTDNDLKTGDIRKEFLEYVRNPKEISLYKKMEKSPDSVLEKEIAEYLVSKGYHIVQQWEAGTYRIDMVALFQEKKVAIGCDGEKWNNTVENIRQDMERQNVLERCGWQFIRIRGSRYFKNPEAVMEEVIEELNQKGIYPENTGDKKILRKEMKLLDKIRNRVSEIIEEWNENNNSSKNMRL